MALYEDVDQQARRMADPRRSMHPTTVARSAAHQDQLAGAVRLIGLALLLTCWVAGAYGGIVYWSFQGSLLGMIGSTVIAGAAAVSTWSAFAALEERQGRRGE